jgi:hypothetical protein
MDHPCQSRASQHVSTSARLWIATEKSLGRRFVGTIDPQSRTGNEPKR